MILDIDLVIGLDGQVVLLVPGALPRQGRLDLNLYPGQVTLDHETGCLATVGDVSEEVLDRLSVLDTVGLIEITAPENPPDMVTHLAFVSDHR